VTRGEESLDREVANFQFIVVRHLLRDCLNAIIASNNHKTGDGINHALITIGVIPMMVGGQNVRDLYSIRLCRFQYSMAHANIDDGRRDEKMAFRGQSQADVGERRANKRSGSGLEGRSPIVLCKKAQKQQENIWKGSTM